MAPKMATVGLQGYTLFAREITPFVRLHQDWRVGQGNISMDHDKNQKAENQYAFRPG